MFFTKRNKYNNNKTCGNDSLLEFDFKEYLIKKNVNFLEKKEVILLEKFTHRGKTISAIKMFPDFFIDETLYVDTKGAVTPVWAIKEKLFKSKMGDNVQLFSIKKAPAYVKKINNEINFIENKLLKELIKIRKKFKDKKEAEKFFPEILVHEKGFFFYSLKFIK